MADGAEDRAVSASVVGTSTDGTTAAAAAAANARADVGFRAPLALTTYSSREAMMAAAQAFARHHGFAFSTDRSKRDRVVYLICDRGGAYRNTRATRPAPRRRLHTSSRKTGCPYRAHAKKSDDGWDLVVVVDEHNHPPSPSPAAHPLFARLSDEQRAVVDRMTAAGKSPRQILRELRTMDPDFVGNARTIYNARQAFRKRQLDETAPASPAARPRIDPASHVEDNNAAPPNGAT